MAETTSPEMPDNPTELNWISFLLQEIRDLRQEIRAVHARFERIDERFERVDERFERVETRMATQFRWTIGVLLVSWMTVAGIFLPPMLQLQSQMGEFGAEMVYWFIVNWNIPSHSLV